MSASDLTPREQRFVDSFIQRHAENRGKQVNNSALVAGSPMYFYCRYCGILTDTLPETYTTQPKRVCDECEVLFKEGLMSIAAAASANKEKAPT